MTLWDEMKSRKEGKNTHEWESDQETVLDDWCHGKELDDKGLIKRSCAV